MIFHFFIQKTNDFSLFVTKIPSQLQKKIQKLPSKCQKYDSVYNTGENELPRSVGNVPGCSAPQLNFSPASATARRSCLTAVAELPVK